MSKLPVMSRRRLLCATGIGAVLLTIPLVQQGCSDAISAATDPVATTETDVESTVIDELHASIAAQPKRAGTQLEVASASDLPEIQPITPGLLQEPPTGIAGDLGILMVGPQGEQNRPMQAVVVFDRPMVPLTDLDQMIDAVPITCGPDLTGKARWAGTTTAVWIPDGTEFPMATEVTCMIPRGTASLDGASLTEDLIWTFRTPALAVTDTWPYDDAKNVDPEQNMLLVFNQSVDPEQLESFIQVEDAQGEALDIDVSTPEEVLNWRYPEDLSRAIVIDAELNMNTTYNVVLAPGAKGLEGELGTEGTYRTNFKTVPPPEILSVGPQGATDSPYVQIYFELSTQTNGQELASKISISPKPPGEWQPSQDWSSRDWYYGVALAPMTTYTVTVEPGFKDIYGQVYDKGTSWTFTTGHYRPLVDVTQNVEVFPANNPKTLPLRSRNLNNLYANVRAVDTDWLMRNHDKIRSTDGKANTEGVRIDLSKEVGIDEAIHLHELDLSAALKDGHGLVQIDVWSPDIRRKRWNSTTKKYVERTVIHRSVLQVTNLGATVKIGANGIHTWVTDLEDGNPVEDAQVELIRNGKVLWTGNSNSAGIAEAPDLVPDGWNSWRDPIWVRVTKGSDQVLAAGKLNQKLSTWEHGVYAQNPDQSESLRTHAFSDRGVYKQGETAHIALSARLTTESGLRLPKEASFDYTCTDANGGEIAQASDQPLQAHGGASFDVSLPSDMALGNSQCQLEIKADGFREWQWVGLPVFAYRTPSFRVDVDGPGHAIAGDTLSVNGNGRYLFGAPMIGAEASWSVRATDSNPQPKGWDEFQFGAAPTNWWDWEEENWEYESSVLVDSGEGVLDKNGQLAVEVKVPVTEAPKTRVFTYEVAVTDVSRQEIANRTQVEVHPAEAYVGLKRSAGIAKAGSKTSFEYVLVDPRGRVIPNDDVQIKVIRRTWDYIRQKGMDGYWTWQTTTNDEEVQTLALRSKSDSQTAKWTPEQGGLYIIQATAKDEAGRTSQTEMEVYVAGSGASWARGDSNKVELVPDKRTYEPGDVAKILVKSPRAGMKALVTVEREGIRQQEVLTLQSTAEVIEVQVAEDAIPNLYVSVILVEGAPPNRSPDGKIPNWYLGYAELPVEPTGKRLEVVIKTDSDRYGPGDTVETKVQVLRDGKPVPDAHVVLYAVDYGVLSLTGYQTPNAFDEYYAHLPLRVYTHDSRTRILDRGQYLSKGARPGGGGGEDGDGMRERFVTTPLWMPNLQTGKRGVVEASFELPDNLTTFQLMAVVDADADSFGSGDHQVIITRDVIARPALPRFFREGDEATAGVVVHNNTQKDLSIEVQAEATGVDLAGAPATVSVAAGGAVEVPFEISNPQVGEAVFRFEANGGGHRDAVKWSIPVSRPQPVDTVATSGSTRAIATEQIGPLSDIIPDVGGLTVSVSPTVLVGSESSLEYLLEYPHGCLEQTTSRLLAAVLANQLNDRIELGITEQRLAQYVQMGVSKLKDFEHYSGGYAYWPKSQSASPVVTGYALEALQRAGETIPKSRTDFLLKFLDGKHKTWWWSDGENLSAQARVALSLARLKKGDAGHNARIFSARDKLSLTSKAELLEAIALTSGTDARTQVLLQEIEAATYVEATITRIRDPETANSRVLWASNMTPSAASVSALVAAYPEHPLLERLAKSLVHSRKNGRWSNTYTTLKAFAALADYAQVVEGDVSGTSVALTLGEQSLLEHAFARPKSTSTQVDMGTGLAGNLQIAADGGLVYYEARLSYAKEQMPPRDEGFTLVRSYKILEGTGSGQEVTPGAVVQVNLRVVTPVDRTMVAVVDPLPAGLEPINQAFKTTAHQDMDEEPEDRRWSTWVFDHQEMADDELRLYASYMPAGIHTYSYLARATTPGDYSRPAATVEEMYRPETFGRTEQGRFTVGFSDIASDE